MKPSSTQVDVAKQMAKRDGRIARERGGFWTVSPMTRSASGAPDWYVSIQTIRAMESRGWLQRRNVHAEEWRDERELTDGGRALAGAT